MRYLLVTFLIAFISFQGIGQSTLKLKYPSAIIEGINTKVSILNTDESFPAIITVNGEQIELDRSEEFPAFNHQFLRGEKLSISGYAFNQPETRIIPLWLSILPPLFAIFFALIYKEVIFSLFSGIFLGGAIIGYYAAGFKGIFYGFLSVIDTYILHALTESSHVSVILFSVMIGGIVALISRNGGMKGIVNRIVKFAKNARSGQLTTYLLGISIFFDDYANSLVVGNTMRAITDKLKISREKLSYIVDSTAAPVSAIAFVTTWIGAELGYIQNGLTKINNEGSQITEGVYSIFLNSLSYSFYPILTLFFMFYLIWRGRDFGPMLKAERRARFGKVVNPEENNADLTEMEDLEPLPDIPLRAINAVLPVLIIVFGTLLGLLVTGFGSLQDSLYALNPNGHFTSWGDIWANMSLLDMPVESFGQKLGSLIGVSDSYTALLWASISAMFVAILLTLGQRIMDLQDTVETVIKGFKSMMPALLILILAWSLALVTEDLHTADFLSGAIEGKISPWLLPAFTFVLSAIVAFSTGSSWSTMALVYPIILPAAWLLCMNDQMPVELAMPIFYNVVSSVLAGSVLGDHCSPISDTTILSSLASGCNHIDHVRTQIPYALTVGSVAVVGGTIPTALGLSPILSFLLAFGVIILIVEFFGKKSDVEWED
ncbi:MAG: Na+/H+ antiporter NhaC family protein [Putridiphycobacter sp.]|nr:Na+/H+ antiporter NhaC family protein [Putridiphycobacter sp.]